MAITKKKLQATGANIEALDGEMLGCLYEFEDRILKKGGKVYLIKNGMNSGKHTSSLHPEGKAVDFTVSGELRPWDIVVEMIRSGFNGIGVYYNGKAYSYHGDTRSKNGQWFCRIDGRNRDYLGLIQTV